MADTKEALSDEVEALRTLLHCLDSFPVFSG